MVIFDEIRLCGLLTVFFCKNWVFLPKSANLPVAPMSIVWAINHMTEGTYCRVKAQKIWCNLFEWFGSYRPMKFGDEPKKTLNFGLFFAF